MQQPRETAENVNHILIIMFFFFLLLVSRLLIFQSCVRVTASAPALFRLN